MAEKTPTAEAAPTQATTDKAPAPAPAAAAVAVAAKPKEKKAPLETRQGQVKSVPSGDTLVVLPFARKGEDPATIGEVTVTLSGIQCPRLASAAAVSAAIANNSPVPRDEPFAWAAREFLRRKCIGTVVSYTLHTAVGGGRGFGTVRLGDEDIARSVVYAGFATVRASQQPQQQQQQQRPEAVALAEAEESARSAGRGLHNKDKSAAAAHVRPIEPSVTPLQFFEENRGKETKGVVEGVRTGSTVRVTFLPSHLTATVSLAGIAAPSVRWVPDRRGYDEEQPFGLESRQFVDSHVMHRDVVVTLRGIDKSDNFTASVVAVGHDVGEELLKLGLARVVPWAGFKELPQYAEKLKAAQNSAVAQKLRIWAKGGPAETTASSPADAAATEKIVGNVVDIPSSGILVVADAAGKRHRVLLASVRAPKIYREVPAAHGKGKGKAKGKPAPAAERQSGEPTKKQLLDNMMATAGRELLRKKIFGTQITCHKRYERTGEGATAVDGPAVYFDAYSNGTNVAMMLLKDGLVEVVQHRATEPRSFDYEAMCLSEKKAQAAKKGVFAPPESTEVRRVNDLSTMDVTHNKAMEFLPFLQRSDEFLIGVVEHVFSASRLKVFVASQNCAIALCIAAIRTPRHHEKEAEPFGEEAFAFTRDKCHMREVLLRVETVDQRGSFVGTVQLPDGTNLATELVNRGFASVIESVARRTPYGKELIACEAKAKAARLGIWEKWTPEADVKREQPKEFCEVTVTDVAADLSYFWVQNVKDAEELDTMTQRLSELAEKPEQRQLARLMAHPKEGEMVVAQFTDGMWYRARCVSCSSGSQPTLTVQYVDFGTTDRVPSVKVQPLPMGMEKIAPMARKAVLAFVVHPTADSEFAGDFAEYFRQLTAGKKLTATIERQDAGLLHVSLADANTHVNSAIVREGLARVGRVYNPSAADEKTIAALHEAEEKAHQERLNMWQYGDIVDEEEY